MAMPNAETATRMGEGEAPTTVSSSLPPLALNHVGITVPDIFAAIEWYVGIFGFSHIMGPRLLLAGSSATHETPTIFGPRFKRAYQAHLLAGNGVGLELFQFIEPPVSPAEPDMAYWRRGPWHLSFTHPEVDATLDRIVAAGGSRRTRAVAFVPGRPWTLGYGADPWSNTIEIVSHTYAEMFSNWPQPGATAVPVWVRRTGLL